MLKSAPNQEYDEEIISFARGQISGGRKNINAQRHLRETLLRTRTLFIHRISKLIAHLSRVEKRI